LSFQQRKKERRILIIKARDNFKKGSVELILLSLLVENELYGYQMAQLISKRSDGEFNLPEGSMYPILYKLEDNGYISSERKLVGKRMTRVYYRIEKSGKEYFNNLLDEYYKVTNSVIKILKYNDKKMGEV